MNSVLAVCQTHTRLALERVLSAEPGVAMVGMASETEGLLALVRSARPELVVLEWGLSGRATGAVLAEARALAGRCRFLVLGRDPWRQQPALADGACAFDRGPARAAAGGAAPGAGRRPPVTAPAPPVLYPGSRS